MCLIIVADTARPTDTEINEAHLSNADGIGIAYRKPHDPLVTWVKGLTPAQAIDLVPAIPLPFIIHFRWATHGGTSPLLCHPFPVSRNVGVTLTGQAKELLFHNGVWSEHVQFARKAALRGPVSDTRIMAYVLWREGIANRDGVAMQIADQAGKLALFTSEGVMRYGNWLEGKADEDDTTEGCYYSNLNHCVAQYQSIHSYGMNWEWVDSMPLTPATTQQQLPDTYCCSVCGVVLPRDESVYYIEGADLCEYCAEPYLSDMGLANGFC
jgi:hypothetical protein